jgi:hypothetical protein
MSCHLVVSSLVVLPKAMSQTRINMSRDGIDAFDAPCKADDVVNQSNALLGRQSCGLDVKPEVAFREGQQ